jgi:hypothetical protein
VVEFFVTAEEGGRRKSMYAMGVDSAVGVSVSFSEFGCEGVHVIRYDTSDAWDGKDRD